MMYAEAAHFDGVPVAHCAAREDHQRRARIAAQSQAAMERAHRSTSRAWPAS